MRWIYLERLANVSIVVAVVLLGYAVVRPGGLASGTRTHEFRLQRDDKVPSIPNVDYSAADKTMLLFLSSYCRYCTESMDFYRRLVQHRANSSVRLQLVVLSREKIESLLNYVQNHGLSADRVESIDTSIFQELRLTPTLILVNAEGKMEQAWLGRQTASGEAEILRAIGAMSGTD